MGIKIVKSDDNSFVWKTLKAEEAFKVFSAGVLELYSLREDGSESLIGTEQQLIESVEDGLEIGIEVGHIGPQE